MHVLLPCDVLQGLCFVQLSNSSVSCYRRAITYIEPRYLLPILAKTRRRSSVDAPRAQLCGTASARFSVAASYPDMAEKALPELATALAGGHAAPPPLEVELELEIWRDVRRTGLGRRVLDLLLRALLRALPELVNAVVRVPLRNVGARAFFEACGFGEARVCVGLDQVELRRTLEIQPSCASTNG